MISPTESAFIFEGIEHDLRIDGRKRLDYRSVDIKLNIVPSANGSCQVTVGQDTQIMCVAKLSIGQESCDNGALNEYVAAEDGYEVTLLNSVAGRIRCHLDGMDSSHAVGNRKWEDTKTEYTSMMDRMLNQQDVIDIKRLSIIPGKLCWIIDLDITVLKNTGNLIDAMFIAARAALQDIRIPHLQVENMGPDSYDYDIDEDRTDESRIITEDVPTCVNLTKVGQHHFVVDPTLKEEECSDAHLTVAVDKRGRIVGIQKGSGSGIPSTMFIDMIQTARNIGQSILIQQDNFFTRQQQIDS